MTKATSSFIVDQNISTQIVTGYTGKPIPTISDTFLVGDSREDVNRNPSVLGIRTGLSLTQQNDSLLPTTGQVWAKSSLRVTHIGNGYDPASPNFWYSLNDMLTLKSTLNTIVYRLGVNDLASLGTEYMWMVSILNAHMNLLGSITTRLTYTNFGSSVELAATQTRGFVQQSSSSYVTVPVVSGEWYCFLIGYRSSDAPTFDLRISDGTVTRYFTSGAVGMAALSIVFRFPVYWKATVTGTVTIDYNGAGTGVFYLGEAYQLEEKTNSQFLLVGETNWNGQVNSQDYYEELRRIHTLASRSARMPWITFKSSQSISWSSETDSAGSDLGHYTNPNLLANSVQKELGMTIT